MIASNVMTSHLLALGENALVQDAVELFRKSSVHEIPVVDGGGRLIGEVNSRSILHKAVPAYASSDLVPAMAAGPDIPSVYRNLEAMLSHRLSDYMTREVQTVHADAPTSAVAAMLVSMGVDSSHVYVVDDIGRLQGVISARDILGQLPEHIGAPHFNTDFARSEQSGD